MKRFRFYAEYHCAFDLKYFPFDIQNCSMIFKMRTATHTKVRFFPLDLVYSGPMDMLEFSLTNYTLEEGKDRKLDLNVNWSFCFVFKRVHCSFAILHLNKSIARPSKERSTEINRYKPSSYKLHNCGKTKILRTSTFRNQSIEVKQNGWVKYFIKMESLIFKKRTITPWIFKEG
jgi:hypothetical protein